MRKLLSEYFSQSGKRKAEVFHDGNLFFVVVTNSAGSNFKSTWDNQTKAEEYAEDWVLNDE
jgi:hypothetical protein